MNKKFIRPIVLTILDGWGYSEQIKGNAIKLAHTPTMDYLWNKYPHALLKASGEDVGLPKHQVGNSEVGHTTIGAGRTINQDLVRIQRSIEDKTFFKNHIIHHMCSKVEKDKSKLHIIGLCSDGGVHSHIKHLKAIINIVYKYNFQICLHIITDGRDTAPKKAIEFIKQINDQIKVYQNIHICSISGRYYSMDRDCRWSRTELAYKVLTDDFTGPDKTNNNDYNKCIQTIVEYYDNNISDEFIPPTSIYPGNITDNDGILFFNFRPDRMRQLMHSLAKKNFKGFKTKKFTNLKIATFTSYDSSIDIPTIFPQEKKDNFLGKIISNHGLKQLRLTETEKYAHVTYFLNGGLEEPFPGEDRELIPSPKVETYDLSPNMSAQEITESAIKAIKKNIYHFIVINYANTDMVGHTGDLSATIKSVKVVDQCLNQLWQTINEEKGTLIITADHGNAEYMLDKSNKPCKSHSTNLVPFMVIEDESKILYNLKPSGSLADIAPTILDILKLNIPIEMDGKSLIQKNNKKIQ